MELKSLSRHFWSLLNVFKLFGIQTSSVAFVSYATAHTAATYGVRGCAGYGSWSSLYFWAFAVIGIVATVVSIYYILQPARWVITVDRHLAFSNIDLDLPFLSTQPIYVFLDVILVLPGIAIWVAGRTETLCMFNFEWAFGWSFLLLSLMYPILRIVSWYGLKRKMRARPVRTPWPTLIMFWILTVPLVGYVTSSYLEANVYPRLRLPVVNEMTFKGGLENNPKFMAGIVRVQGTLVRGIAKCGLFGKDPEKFPFPAGTVLLDMGKRNGQIIVKANRPSMVDELQIEAEGKNGKVFEAFGRLTKLPNPNKKLICGIGKVDSEQRGGVALLEMEMPTD